MLVLDYALAKAISTRNGRSQKRKDKDVAYEVRACRLDITQTTFAEKAGVSASLLSRIMDGKESRISSEASA